MKEKICRRHITGQEIVKSEAKAALAKLDRNIASGPDGSVVEMLEALGYSGIE